MKIIKHTSLLFFIAFIVSASSQISEPKITNDFIQTSYCKGWEEGYCEGWKDVKGQLALCPLAPLCPLPTLDCGEGYKCGYNRGFKAGWKAARK